MSYIDKLEMIDEMQQQIHAHGKLSDEVLDEINKKFRLEWNYTSNNMEGNSLTKMDTLSVMTASISEEGKSVKDIMEMRGHDAVITTLLQIGHGYLNISESRIKDMHKGIMYEPDEERRLMIGKWKTFDNYVGDDNDRYYFTRHTEVKDEMHQLINWVNAENEKIERGAANAMHPVILAFEFHIRFINIHPFHDGNGRMARILTNLILISNGYPPIYIDRDKERWPYYNLLADIQRRGKPAYMFYSHLCSMLLRSQQIVLDAIEGKEIENDDDILKELAVWKKSLPQRENIEYRTDDVVYELYEVYIKFLLSNFIAKQMFFENMFTTVRIDSIVNREGGTGLEYIDGRMQQYYNSLGGFLNPGEAPQPLQPNFHNLRLDIIFSGFKHNGTNAFDYHTSINIDFEPYKWIIRGNGFDPVEKLYTDPLVPQEITALVNRTVRYTKQAIDNQMSK